MSQTPPPSSVQHLVLGWFSMVLGLCGLSLAWHRAIPFLGDLAWWVSLCMGVLAGAVFGCLLLATGWRAWRYPSAVREDLAHPVRHVFVAAVPTSFVLVATVMVTLWGPNALADGLWMLGSATLLAATVWVAQRWLHLGRSPTAFWPAMTPALFIPVVGNVLPALAGVSLGHPVWAAAQYGIAAVLWPVALALVLVRIGTVGMWPQRLLPTTFITMAPPSVLALSGVQLGAPEVLVHMLWGVTVLFTLVSMTVFRRSLSQAFGIPFWGMSFPLAASAALSLHLAPAQGWVQALALAWLVFATSVIAGLLMATVRGLLQGRLLVPEAPQPAPALP